MHLGRCIGPTILDIDLWRTSTSLHRCVFKECVYRQTHTFGAWWRIGRVNEFRQEGRGFESLSGRHVYGHWASPSLIVACSVSACKLRHSVNCCDREHFRKAHARRRAIEMDKYNTHTHLRRSSNLTAYYSSLLNSLIRFDPLLRRWSETCAWVVTHLLCRCHEIEYPSN